MDTLVLVATLTRLFVRLETMQASAVTDLALDIQHKDVLGVAI